MQILMMKAVKGKKRRLRKSTHLKELVHVSRNEGVQPAGLIGTVL